VLRETLGRLLAQDHPDFEIIVADDGSPDETPEVVSSFRDPRIRHVRENRLGMPGIWNAGLRHCRGEYVMTCHDHDIHGPRLLSGLSEALDRHPSAAYAHCSVFVTGSDYKEIHTCNLAGHAPLTAGLRFLDEQLLPGVHCPVVAQSMVRREFLRGEGMDPSYGPCADVELWMRLATRGDVAYVARPLYVHVERDPNSQLYFQGLRNLADVLRAKRRYLPTVTSDRRRAEIEKGWRKDVNANVLLQMWIALRHRKHSELEAIREFVEREGTAVGRGSVAFLRACPDLLRLPLLSSVRWLSRLNRIPRRIRAERLKSRFLREVGLEFFEKEKDGRNACPPAVT